MPTALITDHGDMLILNNLCHRSILDFIMLILYMAPPPLVIWNYLYGTLNLLLGYSDYISMNSDNCSLIL